MRSREVAAMTFTPTDEQQLIIEHDPSHHARVLAGPGTGKSSTMIELIDHLLQENNSLRVRMLTFTRATTAELADKLAVVSEQAEQPSTIHSFAISILLRNPGCGGLPDPLRIPDSWEFANVVRPRLAARTGVGLRRLDKLVHEMASNWESLEDTYDQEITEAERARFLGSWNEHRRVFGYTLLQELPYALHKALQNHDDLDGIDFDFLIVDEYQDLNACDLAVIRQLSEQSGCVVIGTGDDDQSIYSWRNAAPAGIRRFLGDYPSAEDYSLSIPLRCGSKIIRWANYVIQGDPDRPADRTVLHPKQGCPEGEVALLHFPGNVTEAEGVANIVSMLLEKGLAPSDIFILTRTDNNGAFSKPIRAQLEELEIPCSDPSQIIELLTQTNNRTLLEYLRLLINKEDSIAWESLLVLKPGVGPSFYEYIYERAKTQGRTFACELLIAYEEEFPDAPNSAAKVKALIDDVLLWVNETEVPDERPEEGWGTWITALVEAHDTLPALDEEFQRLLSTIDENAQDEEQKLERYLGQIEPLGKDIAQAHSDGVRIMTMGGSKGLTVRATIIAGIEDDICPRPNCDLSEERRILYVAMTRAKEYLFCTWSKRRRGQTARAGSPSMDRRCVSHFLDGGPVQSQDGSEYLRNH